MAQHKFAISLNDNDPEERAWLDGISKSGMIPSHVLKEAMRTYFGTSRTASDYATNNDIVKAIDTGFAMLADRLDNIKQAPVPRIVAREPERRQEEEPRPEPEATEEDLELSHVFVTALKKAARPGMRME